MDKLEFSNDFETTQIEITLAQNCRTFHKLSKKSKIFKIKIHS
jgi:hypothetical protein